MTTAKFLFLAGWAIFLVGLVFGLIVWIPKWLDGFGWPWDPDAWKRRMRHTYGPMSRRDAVLWLISLALLTVGMILIGIGSSP
jgi:hypothetical protein